MMEAPPNLPWLLRWRLRQQQLKAMHLAEPDQAMEPSAAHLAEPDDEAMDPVDAHPPDDYDYVLAFLAEPDPDQAKEPIAAHLAEPVEALPFAPTLPSCSPSGPLPLPPPVVPYEVVREWIQEAHALDEASSSGSISTISTNDRNNANDDTDNSVLANDTASRGKRSAALALSAQTSKYGAKAMPSDSALAAPEPMPQPRVVYPRPKVAPQPMPHVVYPRPYFAPS